MTEIPKSQRNQACVRHDGAGDGTKVPPLLLQPPQRSQRFHCRQSGSQLLGLWGGGGRVVGVPGFTLNMRGNNVERRCLASFGVSRRINPVSHYLQLMTACSTSPQTLIINI